MLCSQCEDFLTKLITYHYTSTRYHHCLPTVLFIRRQLGYITISLYTLMRHASTAQLSGDSGFESRAGFIAPSIHRPVGPTARRLTTELLLRWKTVSLLAFCVLSKSTVSFSISWSFIIIHLILFKRSTQSTYKCINERCYYSIPHNDFSL